MLKFLLSRPAWASLCLTVVTTLLTVFATVFLTVEGDVAQALKGTSKAFLAHSELEAKFGAPSKDEIFFVRAKDFGDPKTFAALEDLVLGFQLADSTKAVLSIFTLPNTEGVGLSYLAGTEMSALPPDKRLDSLLEVSPLAQFLISPDRSAVLLTVIQDLSATAQDRILELEHEIAAADPALTVKFVGLAALQREISAALVTDQLIITPAAGLLCIAIALFLFRSWRAALVCAIPSILGLGWTLGVIAALGLPITPFMAIVPTLIIILGIADSVHVFHAVMNHAKETDTKSAVAIGLRETMPAVILAALTTALAFFCLVFVGSPTITDLALVGPIGMALTTLAVFFAMPPAILLLYGRKPLAKAQPLKFRSLTTIALALLSRNRAVSFFAFISFGVLLVVQTQTVIGYRPMDHVPRGGEFQKTLADLNAVLPGSDVNFAILNAADPLPGTSVEDHEMLSRAGKALYGTEAGIYYSQDEGRTDSAIYRRFESEDGSVFALPVIRPLDRTWVEVLATAEQMRDALLEVGIDDARIAGYSLMSSVELPIVVRELRVAFYVAVTLVTVLAAVLLRSIRISLLSLVPNLIPILGVEAWLVLTDRPLTVTGALAFTIAFGIAVDDTIHLLNRLRLERKRGAPIDRKAIELALRAVTAPIMITSLVLLAGFTVTAFSQLPSVSVFGQLTAAAMALALIADIFLFPSLLCWGGIGAPTK